MDLIYSMKRKPLKCEPPNYDSISDPETVHPICTISIHNIIAFTSFTELSDTDGGTWAGHVYVCDMNTPWNSHKVTTTVYPVSALEWDCEGKQLVVCTTAGDVAVYGQRDCLLNDWLCLYSANFAGEKIISAIFFETGRRIVSLDKKQEAPITDRLQVSRSTPTLKGFGGIGVPGVLAVTGTGLVVAVSAGEGSALTACEPLRPARDMVRAAALAHKKGSILIACECGRAVRASAAHVTRAGPLGPLSLRLTRLPTLTLPDEAKSGLVSLSWCVREEGEALVRAGSTLALWRLADRPHHTHKLLAKGPVQGSTTPGGGPKPTDCYTTLWWEVSGSWPLEADERCTDVRAAHGHYLAAVTTTRALRLLGDKHHYWWEVGGSWPLEADERCTDVRAAHGHYLAAVTTTRALRLLGDKHHYVCSRPVPTAEVSAPSSTPPKKPKYGPGVANRGAWSLRSVCASWWGGALAAVDAHSQLHLYHVHPPDSSPAQIVSWCGSALERALVSGLDYLDVLLALKHSLLETLYERITESFQRQPASFQQHYYYRWLRMRLVICSMLPSAQSSASNLTCALVSGATSAACASALRPDEREHHAHPLLQLLDDDHDKNLIALEAKAEAIGEAAGTALLPLQALRRPLLRALHTALTALAAFTAQHTGHNTHNLYDLHSDPAALSLLRRLLVLYRAARSRPERTAALQSALARLAALAPLTHGVKPDLLEECVSVCSAQPGRVWESLSRCGVAAPHLATPPYYLEYGVEAESLRAWCAAPTHAASDLSPHTMDAVRYTYLGGVGGCVVRCRECVRCGARSLPAAARHPAQRAHDSRYHTSCRCGGKWTLVSNV